MTQSDYDALAAAYDSSILETPYYAHLNARYTEIMTENLRNFHLSPLLDIGCGTGLYMEVICRGTTHYLGIDLSKEMLRKARLKSETIGRASNASFVRADALFLPFKRRKVGGIVSIGMVLSHLPSYEKGLAEISRVLMKEGQFLIELDNKWSVDFLHYLADGLTAGKIFSYGFSSLRSVSRYLQRDEYEWDARLDGLPAPRKILLHKISISRLKRLLTATGLRIDDPYGVHFATLFIPKTFPCDGGVSSAYLRLVERLDRWLSRSCPFAQLGGSLIIAGGRKNEREIDSN